MKSQGFSLVWALVLAAVLAVVAASLVQSASTSNRSVQAVSQGTLRDIERRNLLSYSQRLLEANLGSLVRNLGAPSSGVPELLAQLQSVTNTWCDRDPDGNGAGRVQVYFTAQACGTGLPSGVTLPNATLSTTNGLSVLEAPFVLVAGPRTQRGTLRTQYGAAPASVYALLSDADLDLDSNLQIDGSVHTDGQLELMGTPRVTTTVSASGCAVISAQCVGERRIRINGQRQEVMGLLPSPAHPLGLAATLSLGQNGESAGLSSLTLSGLTAVASQVTLGVLESGEQLIKICAGGCVTYVGLESGDLALSSGEIIVPNWNGVIGLTPLTSRITLTPQSPDAPSIVRPISIVTSGAVTIDGSLTYAQTSCAGDVCNTSGAKQFLSVQASDIVVSSQTVRVHGVLITPQLRRSEPLTIFGAVIGAPRGNGLLRIQEDPRSRTGQAAPGVPRLAAQWRQAEVDLTP